MCDLVSVFAGPAATLVQTIVIAIGAFVGWVTIKSNSDIAKKRATLDLITHVLQGPEYKEQLLIVRAMKKAGEDSGALFTHLTTATGDQHTRNRTNYLAAQFVLNKFSVMSIGIRNNALDEQSFKEYYYSTFVEVAGYLRGLMLSVRTAASKEIVSRNHVSNETVYEEIFWLLDRWKDNPLKSRASSM